MSAPRKLPDTRTLAILRSKGWRINDIAQEYGVSTTAVWKALNKANLTRTSTYRDILPWTVEKQHVHAQVMANFRAILKQQLGEPLPPEKEARLSEWLQQLEEADLVVAYHKDCPPNPASPKSGGFYYVPREPRDQWIIRMPDDEEEDPVDHLDEGGDSVLGIIEGVAAGMNLGIVRPFGPVGQHPKDGGVSHSSGRRMPA